MNVPFSRIGGVAVWILATAGPVPAVPPSAMLEDTTPGINQSFDSIDPVNWGRHRTEIHIGTWTVSGGRAEAMQSAGSAPRIVYSATTKGYPPDPIGADDTPMPTGDGWVASIRFRYMDEPLTAVVIEGGFELQLLGPVATGSPNTFIVHLRNYTPLSTFTLPQDTDILYTVHYWGLNHGNLLDIWIDDTLVVDGYDLDGAAPDQPFPALMVQLGGGGGTSWTLSFDELYLGLPEGEPDVVSSTPVAVHDGAAVSFDSELGRAYFLEYTADPVGGSWNRIGGRVDGDGTLLSLHDLSGATSTRIYRVLRLP